MYRNDGTAGWSCGTFSAAINAGTWSPLGPWHSKAKEIVLNVQHKRDWFEPRARAEPL
jgi:hypothetical protein